MRLRPRYRDLPIRLKLLAPFAVLMILWGAFGSFVLVRGQASEARTRAASRLADSFNGARSAVTDIERALIETVRLGTHTRGVGRAIASGDSAAVAGLLRPLAVNANAPLLAVATDGTVLAQIDPTRSSGAGVGAPPGTTTRIGGDAVGRAARGVADDRGDTWAEFAGTDLLVAAPARVAGRAVGAVIASEDLAAMSARMARGSPARITLFSTAGARLASSGPTAIPFRSTDTGLITRVRAGTETFEVLYGPLVLRGARAGTIAVALPSGVAGTGVGRDIALLTGLIGAAVLLAVAIGMATARAITRPLTRVVRAARALEAGDLGARADTPGHDEVGMLGHAFNAMATELQASHEELERKVADRTAELEAVNVELARVSRAKSDFLAMMSHELRTPLNAVIGFADMLSDPSFGRPTVSTTRELSGNILASGRHLLTLINDVLDLAKVEAGKIEVDPEPIDLREILAEVGAIVRPLAQAKRQDLRAPAATVIPTVLADPARLRQVLFNLIANAIKFTPDGGRIMLDVEVGADAVTLSVADDGPGMSEEECARVFDPFERGSASGRVEGAGLGLSLARRLVELQGGEIWVRATPGRGSTFSFTVPLAPARAAVGRARAADGRARAAGRVRGKRKEAVGA